MEKSEISKTSPPSELEPGPLAQESSVYIHLSYLPVDECRWKKIDQVISAATDNCTSTVVASACKTQTRSFRFALFKYKHNIHLALVNIGWYLARDMALGAHVNVAFDRVYIFA